MLDALVFGCGGVGLNCKHYLEKQGIKVIAFLDNDILKWGSFVDGIKVISPDNIFSLSFNLIAIGNYKAAESIKRQLLNLGVNDNKIIIPFVPRRIFNNDVVQHHNKQDISLKESELTRWYRSLGINVKDALFLKKIVDLKNTLIKFNIDLQDVCVVSGAIFQVLGLKNSKSFDDIDIIMSSPYRKLYGNGLVIVSETCEMHPKDEYYITDDEIINISQNHFFFNDIKFMNPVILYRYLLSTERSKDAELLQSFLYQNGLITQKVR